MKKPLICFYCKEELKRRDENGNSIVNKYTYPYPGEKSHVGHTLHPECNKEVMLDMIAKGYFEE